MFLIKNAVTLCYDYITFCDIYTHAIKIQTSRNVKILLKSTNVLKIVVYLYQQKQINR